MTTPSASTASHKPTIGYVGVGLMGGAMVERLLECGWSVKVCDVDPEKVERLQALGALVGSSPADTAGGRDLVLLNLPSAEATDKVLFGPGGLAESSVGCVVDFSTIAVDHCRRVASELRDRNGARWIDAPVSGGPHAARTGSLTVMAGGGEDDIRALGGLLADISANFTRVGGLGDGLVAKMISQLIVGCTHAVLAEAASLAAASGIDPSVIPSCVSGGHADGVLLRQLYPRMVARDFTPHAFNRQLAKDMHMVRDLARVGGTPTPMVGQALLLYDILVNLGRGDEDVATVVTLFENAAGVAGKTNSRSGRTS